MADFALVLTTCKEETAAIFILETAWHFGVAVYSFATVCFGSGATITVHDSNRTQRGACGYNTMFLAHAKLGIFHSMCSLETLLASEASAEDAIQCRFSWQKVCLEKREIGGSGPLTCRPEGIPLFSFSDVLRGFRIVCFVPKKMAEGLRCVTSA